MQTWIQSRRFDTTLIMGGAFISMTLAFVASVEASLVSLIFWAWVMLLEGPHFAITWVRTFGDSKFFQDNRTLLLSSFAFFVIPLLAVAYDGALATTSATGAWGFLIFLWSLYHNTRQHYGFVALWARQKNLPETDLTLLRWGTYIICYAFMAELLFNFKLNSAYPAISAFVPWSSLQLLATSAAILVFTGLSVKLGKRSMLPLTYLALVGAYYYVLFHVVAYAEPFFPGPMGAAEGFLIVTVLNSSFHNIQYLAITVWRAKRDNVAELQKKTAACFFFGALVFTPIFWARGEVRMFDVAMNHALWSQVAYVLYFGIVGQHFFLDQYIWRSKKKSIS